MNIPFANEDPIIRFHDENMDDFSEDEDQQFFDHINHQSDDQTNEEGVGRPTTPPSPPLQYQQPRQDHRQLNKHVIAQIIQPIVKTNPIVSIKTLIAEIKMFMNYTPSYKNTWLAKQRELEMIHENWEESYVKLPKVFGALQSCVSGTVVAAQTKSLYEGGEIVPGKRLFKRVFWSFGPCINGFVYCKPIVQVDGTKFYGKYTGTLLIATAQDGANHIFLIAYAIVEGETTSAWGYAYIEKMHWQHLGDIRANKPSAAKWLDQLPKQKLVQCFDEGKRWGHMTTNLSESVNSMFKNTRHLLVSSLVEETYFKTAQLFANRGRQTQAMINSGSQYSEVVFDAMNSGQQESNTHIVNEFDRHNHTFIITETQSPLETPRPPERFRVMLQSQKCDCGEYQAKHLSCSHVMTVCKSVNVDPMTYVSMLFTLQHILHIYDNSFGLLPHESMWQEYEGD
ncbi:hypothetical protein HKD37_01G001937 [Glycine soja]